MARIRNALARATHDFFQSHGFLYVHTPIVTTSDCEGAGEMFQARGLLSADLLSRCMGCSVQTFCPGAWAVQCRCFFQMHGLFSADVFT